MAFVKRKASRLCEAIKKSFLERIVMSVKMPFTPQALIINLETGLKLVPVSSWTLVTEDAILPAFNIPGDWDVWHSGKMRVLLFITWTKLS